MLPWKVSHEHILHKHVSIIATLKFPIIKGRMFIHKVNVTPIMLKIFSGPGFNSKQINLNSIIENDSQHYSFNGQLHMFIALDYALHHADFNVTLSYTSRLPVYYNNVIKPGKHIICNNKAFTYTVQKVPTTFHIQHSINKSENTWSHIQIPLGNSTYKLVLEHFTFNGPTILDETIGGIPCQFGGIYLQIEKLNHKGFNQILCDSSYMVMPITGIKKLVISVLFFSGYFFGTVIFSLQKQHSESSQTIRPKLVKKDWTLVQGNTIIWTDTTFIVDANEVVQRNFIWTNQFFILDGNEVRSDNVYTYELEYPLFRMEVDKWNYIPSFDYRFVLQAGHVISPLSLGLIQLQYTFSIEETVILEQRESWCQSHLRIKYKDVNGQVINIKHIAVNINETLVLEDVQYMLIELFFCGRHKDVPPYRYSAVTLLLRKLSKCGIINSLDSTFAIAGKCERVILPLSLHKARISLGMTQEIKIYISSNCSHPECLLFNLSGNKQTYRPYNYTWKAPMLHKHHVIMSMVDTVEITWRINMSCQLEAVMWEGCDIMIDVGIAPLVMVLIMQRKDPRQSRIVDGDIIVEYPEYEINQIIDPRR
jgi:hypothetical protein